MRGGRAEATPLHGGHRQSPGPRGIQRRMHLSRPRRPLRPHRRRQACRGRRRTGPPVGALAVPASTTRTGQRADAGTPRRPSRRRTARDHSSEPAAAAAGSAASALEVRVWDWTTGSRCSGPSGTLGASRSPTAASAAPDARRRRFREHHQPGHRLAPDRNRLHRDHAATPLPSQARGLLS